MSIYYCEECDQQKDSDYELSEIHPHKKTEICERCYEKLDKGEPMKKTINDAVDQAMENIKREVPDISEDTMKRIGDNTAALCLEIAGHGLTKDNFHSSCQTMMDMGRKK